MQREVRLVRLDERRGVLEGVLRVEGGREEDL